MASACATTLGSVGSIATLAAPADTPTITFNKFGTYMRMPNNQLRFTGTGSNPVYRVWDVRWEMQDTTAQAAIQAEALRTGSMIWSPPTTDTTYNVLVTDYRETAQIIGAGFRYNIAMRLEEIV